MRRNLRSSKGPFQYSGLEDCRAQIALFGGKSVTTDAGMWSGKLSFDAIHVKWISSSSEKWLNG